MTAPAWQVQLWSHDCFGRAQPYGHAMGELRERESHSCRVQKSESRCKDVLVIHATKSITTGKASAVPWGHGWTHGLGRVRGNARPMAVAVI